MNTDLFDPIVPVDRLHPLFQSVRAQRMYAAARRLMNQIFATLVDADGNFIEQFQTVAFDARTWELYLHAYFTLGGFQITDRKNRPDYILERAGHHFCVEAVTTNPRDGSPTIDPSDPERLRALLSNVSGLREQQVLKLAQALRSKLKKHYWDLPHVAGKPLVFAVEAFHGPEALAFSDVAAREYLYGLRAEATRDAEGHLLVRDVPITEHRVGTKSIPSGFFALPDAEYVSAVLFTNAGTIAKFARMAQQGPLAEPGVTLLHAGNCYDPEPDASDHAVFEYVVGERSPLETWGEGVTVFHNPRAKYPLSRDVFDEVCQQYTENGEVVADVPWFHPYRSTTTLIEVVEDVAETRI